MSTPTTPDGGQPRRIQRRRTKGWRMPEDAVYVGRPSKWGNPFMAPDPAVTVAAYRSWLTDQTWRWQPGPPDCLELTAWYERRSASGRSVRYNFELLWVVQSDLRGLDLACWCRLDQPCHADVLLELANGDPTAGG